VLAAGATAFISYALWPTWPSDPVALDAPALPITVAGVLFELPPAAIRETVQRHPGQHERVDLAFAWPSLGPPLTTNPTENHRFAPTMRLPPQLNLRKSACS
jgi:hypothetical protein